MSEKESKSDKIWVLLFSIIFFVLLIYVVDWGFIKGSITEYPIQCPSNFHEGNGCYSLRSTTYYPDTKLQTVKKKDDFEIETLKKCSVINRTNWECRWDDESATFGFINGQFHSTYFGTGLGANLLEKMEKETHYGGRIEYLIESWNLR